MISFKVHRDAKARFDEYINSETPGKLLPKITKNLGKKLKSYMKKSNITGYEERIMFCYGVIMSWKYDNNLSYLDEAILLYDFCGYHTDEDRTQLY